ncbi:MAG TPA: methyltransferase domain-containing protein [Rubrobacter sp.]|nr:methyltransferase domain-containing protein [Rubrobacter sp.]
MANLVASPGRLGEAARWQRRVEGFVLDQIGNPPARVLEVGCGKGDLAYALVGAGYSVTAIDPRAREVPIFRRVGIEEFSGQMLEEIGRRFAQRSFSRRPYLYPDLGDNTSEADGLAAIEAGEINATSFCYVGAVASDRSAFTRWAGA